MSRAVAYLRVSTERQQRSGLGIEAQRVTIARFAQTEGLTIVAKFVEAESGKGSDALDLRPQLAGALAAARSAKVQRRGFEARPAFPRCRIRIGPYGSARAVHRRRAGPRRRPFRAALYAALAEKEHRLISERAKAALAGNKASERQAWLSAQHC
jgi:DNA invertase Pin-like site-specific DNA recombinase